MRADRAIDSDALPARLCAPAAKECREIMQEWKRRGVKLFMVGGDKLLLADCVRRYVGQLRA